MYACSVQATTSVRTLLIFVSGELRKQHEWHLKLHLKVAWQEYRSLRKYSDINCMALISPLRQSSSLQQHDSKKLILTLNATRNFDSFPIAKQPYNIIMAHRNTKSCYIRTPLNFG